MAVDLDCGEDTDVVAVVVGLACGVENVAKGAAVAAADIGAVVVVAPTAAAAVASPRLARKYAPWVEGWCYRRRQDLQLADTVIQPYLVGVTCLVEPHVKS